MSRDERIRNDLEFYGSGILCSEEFRKSFRQKHHIDTTVGEHTLYVSRTSLKIAYFLKKLHVKTNMGELVVVALCHDLGILGRDEKYPNKRSCYRKHPGESKEVARRLVPELNERTEKMIERHMFPVTIKPPVSKEGYILLAADKYCAVREGARALRRALRTKKEKNKT
ncbi:MAG: HD domain-containing protein [Lachnospiraceae bacterium]|nr:HD domain-containing protein [Lachnospiraceae bacterium]